MSLSFGSLLRRHLSPKTFSHLVYFRYYWLALAKSVLIARRPRIWGLNGGRIPEFFAPLRAVNVLAPTSICQVMYAYGSDKALERHNYTTLYAILFRGLFDKPLRIFELGLGTNNPELASTMGSAGVPGASLRGWRQLFPHALVYGADIDRTILFEDERIKTFYCDQLDAEAIRQLWQQPDLREGMDILVEDGLHTYAANLSFLDGSLEHLRPGGIYIVEDIATVELPRWREEFALRYGAHLGDYEAVLIELPNAVNPRDNNLLLVHRIR
jgi:SAM-dependent methyltransferase